MYESKNLIEPAFKFKIDASKYKLEIPSFRYPRENGKLNVEIVALSPKAGINKES